MNQYTELVASISTKHDLSEFIQRLEETQRGLFRTGTDVEDFISEQFALPVTSAIVSYAQSQKANLQDPGAATQFFASLVGSLRQLPLVTLRLAYLPTRKQLQDFSRWFVENTGEHVIFDIVPDPKLIGGAIIEYSGRIGNYSLEKRIGEFFASGTQIGNSPSKA